MSTRKTSAQADREKGEVLLEIEGLKIEGFADDAWHPIVNGVDITLKRGEVLGLIGESGAGKSTIGLAAMGFARPGCRISGGSIVFDGMDLRAASEDTRRQLARLAHRLCGTERGGLLQSRPQAHRPDHRDGAVASYLQPREGGQRRHRPLRPTAASLARDHRRSLSPSGLRRPASARHDRHGHVMPARPHHLR